MNTKLLVSGCVISAFVNIFGVKGNPITPEKLYIISKTTLTDTSLLHAGMFEKEILDTIVSRQDELREGTDKQFYLLKIGQEFLKDTTCLPVTKNLSYHLFADPNNQLYFYTKDTFFLNNPVQIRINGRCCFKGKLSGEVQPLDSICSKVFEISLSVDGYPSAFLKQDSLFEKKISPGILTLILFGGLLMILISFLKGKPLWNKKNSSPVPQAPEDGKDLPSEDEIESCPLPKTLDPIEKGAEGKEMPDKLTAGDEKTQGLINLLKGKEKSIKQLMIADERNNNVIGSMKKQLNQKSLQIQRLKEKVTNLQCIVTEQEKLIRSKEAALSETTKELAMSLTEVATLLQGITGQKATISITPATLNRENFRMAEFRKELLQEVASHTVMANLVCVVSEDIRIYASDTLNFIGFRNKLLEVLANDSAFVCHIIEKDYRSEISDSFLGQMRDTLQTIVHYGWFRMNPAFASSLSPTDSEENREQQVRQYIYSEYLKKLANATLIAAERYRGWVKEDSSWPKTILKAILKLDLKVYYCKIGSLLIDNPSLKIEKECKNYSRNGKLFEPGTIVDVVSYGVNNTFTNEPTYVYALR